MGKQTIDFEIKNYGFEDNQVFWSSRFSENFPTKVGTPKTCLLLSKSTGWGFELNAKDQLPE
jgi:hypothetical protein